MKETLYNHPTKNSRFSTSNSNITRKVDRLSALPDSLLVDILSLLCLDAAARTSILSHRWQNLWTHITHFHMDRFDSQWPTSGKYSKFHTFCFTADHIIRQLKSPKIRTFHLVSTGPESEQEIDQCSSLLGWWVPLICTRKPEQITLIFSSFESHLPMPMCILQCPSLVKLKINAFFTCNRLGNVCLPNLKELDLSYLEMDLKLIGELIKACPLLEVLNLFIDSRAKEFVLDISAQNLKSLCVEVYAQCGRIKLIISTPNLQSISLNGEYASCQFVSRLSALQSATIAFKGAARVSEILELVGGFRYARVLRLSDSLGIFNILKLHPVVLEMFRNLTGLSLSYDSAQRAERTELIPAFMLSRLKYIEIQEMHCSVNALKLVKFILGHAKLLETLIVDVYHCRGSGKDEIWREYRFCDALFELAKTYFCCDIKFQGLYMNASSRGYQEGELSCRVRYKNLEYEAVSDSDSYDSDE